MLKRYSEEDGDLEVLKDKIIAVIGYGSQGEAQANCFKDSGLNVIVGLRKGESWEKAEKEGHNVMSVSDAVENASIIHVLIPDEVQGEVYNNSIRSYLTKGKTLSFSHGFSITYGIIKPPEDVNVIMVAPMGPGPEVRSSYQAGSGIASLIAIKQDAEDGLRIALALAKGILAQVRGKFTTIPIPGQSVTLNASDLSSQSKEEQEKLREELKTVLAEMTYAKVAEVEANMVKSANEILKTIPYGVYVG